MSTPAPPPAPGLPAPAPPPPPEAQSAHRPLIVQRLREIQNRFGFLPDDQLRKLVAELKAAGRADVSLARIEEIVSFFGTFRREWDPPAVIEVHVCRDYTCHRRGARDLLARLPGVCDTPPVWALITDRLLARPVLRNDAGEVVRTDDGEPARAADADRSALVGLVRENFERGTPDRNRFVRTDPESRYPEPNPTQCRVEVRGVSCLGRCDRAPVVWIERHPHPEGVHAWLVADLPARDPAVSAADEVAARVAATVRQIASGDIPPCAPDDTAPAPVGPELIPAPPAPPPTGWTIDPYPPDGHYGALDRVCKALGGFVRPWPERPDEALLKEYPELAPGEVVRAERFIRAHNPSLSELRTAGLLGMGGAGEPAYEKWLKLWKQPGEAKYVVANGDESEPGTFKDRELMLHFPHLVVEGVILAALMTGATGGYIYVRHEYPEQIHALRREVARARRHLTRLRVSFELDVLESPGGYICGEQSALIEAIEDRRAQPRNRPPELQANGLWNCPTVVNNVETFAWVPAILTNGGKWYKEGGLPPSRGRRLFSVSGDVRRPGVYEVPIGLRFRELLNDPQYCGGVVGELRAIAPSGPSGGLIPPRIRLPIPPGELRAYWAAVCLRVAKTAASRAEVDLEQFVNRIAGGAELDVLDLPLDLNFFRQISEALGLRPGLALGGGLAVYAGAVDALDLAVNFTRFFRNESCGKCVPCRVGSQKLYQIGSDLLSNREQVADAGVRDDIGDLTDALGQTAICGLGHVAGVPLRTALTYFDRSALSGPALNPGG